MNGSVGTVLGVVPGPSILETRIIALVDDRRISFALADVADENGNAQIGWDLWLERFWKPRCDGRARAGARRRQLRPHLAYVTASRARARTHLFVDGASVDAIDTDLSFLGALSEEAERLVKLSRRMARNKHQAVDLDYIPRADWDRWHISPPAAAAPVPNAQLDRFAETKFDHV